MAPLLDYGLPAAYAVVAWWLSTGAILFLVRLPRRFMRWTMLGGTAALALALHGLTITAGQATTLGAYVAFTCGIVIFGFQELSFYTGLVTGPRKHACPSGCRGSRHFRHGVEAILYHELALVATAVLVVALTWGEPNQIGAYTFMVLWFMQQSAKLNLFLGARNLNEDFLPDHLRYLGSFFRTRSMNLLFPLSVTLATVATVLLARSAAGYGPESFGRSGFTFLATLMGLAVLEHWFLVLPLDASGLWRWSFASSQRKTTPELARVATVMGRGE